MTTGDIAIATPIWSALAGVIVGGLITFVGFRRKQHEMRMRRFSSARTALEMHIEGMKRLDRDDTPDAVLELATQFAEVIASPLGPMLLDSMLAENPNLFAPRAQKLNSTSHWDDLAGKPEIIEALFMVLFGGMRAFAERHPETSPAFDNFVMNFSASPVARAQDVVREARRYVGRQPAAA